MNAQINTADLRLRMHRGAWLRQGAGLVLGTSFSWGLFYGIASYLATNHDESPQVTVEEVRSTVYAAPPAPPSTKREVEAEKLAASMALDFAGFEASPSESSVKITAAPASLGTVFSPDVKLPPIKLADAVRTEVFQPKIEPVFEREHVFQTNEVDKGPEVLSRSQPNIPSKIMKGKKVLRVEFIFVLDENGKVGEVRILSPSGNSEYDKLMAASVKTWTFSPAMRKGKPVRCLISQPVELTPQANTPFAI